MSYFSFDTLENSSIPTGWQLKKLKEICQINPTMNFPKELSGDAIVSFVPMAAVDEKTGEIVKLEARPIQEVWKGYKRFKNGDVIFARITPCMENGKAAIANNLGNGIGCGSTEFHVFRPDLNFIMAEWIYHFIRQPSFREKAAASMTGTAGQLRVPLSFLEEQVIPLPPVNVQKQIIEKISTIKEQTKIARTAVFTALQRLDALEQAALAKAFRGEL